jgi:hypothetical protein
MLAETLWDKSWVLESARRPTGALVRQGSERACSKWDVPGGVACCVLLQRMVDGVRSLHRRGVGYTCMQLWGVQHHTHSYS